MSFDALSLKILALETKNLITGRTIDKILEHRNGEYGFILRNESGPSILLISINPNFPAFFHTTEHKINFTNNTSNYQLLMKKYFEGARIIDVRTFYSDRILALNLLKKDNFSENEYMLFFEFMGKHSNSFVYQGNSSLGELDQERVIGALNFSHNLCNYLNHPQKKDIADIRGEEAAGIIIAAANAEAEQNAAAAPQAVKKALKPSQPGCSKELIKSHTGLSPFLFKTAASRPLARAISEIAEFYNLKDYSGLTGLINRSNEDEHSIFSIYNPGVYFQDAGPGDKLKIFAYPFDISAIDEKVTRETGFGSLNECYAHFYITRDMDFITSKLRGKISKLNDIAEKKKETFTADLISSADYQKYSNYGGLIISSLNEIKSSGENKKLESISISGVTIPLDARVLVSDNAQRFFKISKRLKSKNEYCKNIIAGVDKILEKIVSCRNKLNSPAAASSKESCGAIEREIIAIANELIYDKRSRKKFISEFNGEMKIFAACVVKKDRAAEENKNAAAGDSNKHYRLFKSEDGLLIYVGRSDTGNDYILSKIAAQQDYWFHVKDFRGSSVILKTPKNAESEAVERALEEAALYAAYYSQGRHATKIFVSCAMRKYVKKLKRIAGKVTYSNERSILVDVNKLEEKFGRE